MAKLSEVYEGEFLRAADLSGRAVIAEIERYELRENKFADSKFKKSPVLFFKGRKKCARVNQTNGNNIAFAYGDDLDGWVGHKIEISPTTYFINGQNIEGLLMRPVRTAPDLDDEIPF
jgi:hypothetical protein